MAEDWRLNGEQAALKRLEATEQQLETLKEAVRKFREVSHSRGNYLPGDKRQITEEVEARKQLYKTLEELDHA